MRSVYLLAVAVLATSAHGQLSQRQLGLMLSRDHSARPVYGITSSVTLGTPVASGVLSVACSKLLCLMKTDSSILSPTGIAAAPPGPALFSFSSASVLIYFPTTRQLARWHDNQLDPVDFDVAGEILGVRAITGGTEFAIRNDAGVWLVGPGNTILQSLDGATGPVILLDGGVLFATRDALILRRPNIPDLRFEIDRTESLSWLGEQYVQISTRRGSYALRIDPGRERLFLLPEPSL